MDSEVPVLRYMNSLEMPRTLEREDSTLPQGGKLYRVLVLGASEESFQNFGFSSSLPRGAAFRHPERPSPSQLALYFKLADWVVPVPQTLHVLLIILSGPQDIEAVQASCQSYGYCSQKYVLAPTSEEILTFAMKLGAVYKTPEDLGDLNALKNLVDNEEKRLTELVGNVFSEFDKDKSGFIDVHEIEAMASQLGTSVTSEELQVIMEDVDTDKDGKISRDEFMKWWLKGRKGKAKLMRELTSRVTKVKGFLAKYGPDVRRMMGSTEPQSSEQSQFSFKLSSGLVEHPGLQARLALSVGSTNSFSALAPEADLKDIMFIVALKINEGVDAEALRATVDTYVQQGLRILADTSRAGAALVNEIYAKVSLVDDKLVVGLMSQGGPMVEQLKGEYSHLGKLLTACEFEQAVEVGIKMEASPESMSWGEDRLLFEHFLDGLELQIKVKMWRFYREMLAWAIKRRLRGHEQFLFLLTLLSEGHLELSLDDLDLLPSATLISLRRFIERRAPFLLIKSLKNAKKLSSGLAQLPLILSVNETLLSSCSSAKVEVMGKFFDISWVGSVCLPNLSALVRFS